MSDNGDASPSAGRVLSDPSPEYDAFISYASEDREWAEGLAERLRNAGVRVWFDRWQLKPGSHLQARINDGLQQSHKVVAVWSRSYFRDDKVWTLVESYSQQHADMLARDRPLIPLLIDDCADAIKPTLRSIVRIDFSNPADIDLRFRELIDALDLPRRDFAIDILDIPFERGAAEAGRLAHQRGKRFEDEVASLYRLLGFDVTVNTQIGGIQIDLQIRKREGGLTIEAIVECKDTRITAKERDQILAQQNVVQRKFPRYRWIAVSSIGFAADTRVALEESGYECVTYAELLHGLVPLDSYVNGYLAERDAWLGDEERGWGGRDLFIRPDLEVDVTYEKRAALAHIGAWLGDTRSNLLVVLGDLGTGKTTLSQFVAYQMARCFRDDQLRHPAPVVIPLGKMRKEVALESIVVRHFRECGVTGLDYRRFEHLVRLGKIVIFFDAFDEMADRVRPDVTEANFQELRRAVDGGGKALLTCRTHYFKDRTEQSRLIGEGPSLTAAETALYKELRQQSGAEVVYLQEFSELQIRDYLERTRGAAASEDWTKIQTIYNLRDLAQRPLLLEMIVKTLPKLQQGQELNAASLYTVYTNAWVDRDFVKGRIVLKKGAKLTLMMELAWRMWADEQPTFSTKQLVAFVAGLHSAKAVEFGDEEVDDIAREVQAASFLRRDRDGDTFRFMHQSFAEFFLARKIFATLAQGDRSVLETRRFDQKTIYFLSLLDGTDTLLPELQSILSTGYTRQVSEHALQILYWSSRIRCGMEEQIDDLERLKRFLAERLPNPVKLAGAQLREMVLQGATFRDADFSDADLSKSNLCEATFIRTGFIGARLAHTRAERITCEDVSFARADLREALLPESKFARVDFSGSRWSDTSTGPLRILGVVPGSSVPRRERIPVIQLGSAGPTRAVAWSRESGLLAVSGADGVIRIYQADDGRLLRTLEGHLDGVSSVTFDPLGTTLASGSYDRTVKLWNVASGQPLHTLGHPESVMSVAFHPLGRTLASGSHDKTVRLWDVATGAPVLTLEGHRETVNCVAFDSPSGTIASGSHDGTVKLWGVESGQLLHTLEGHRGPVMSVAFDGPGRMLASGSQDHTVKLWDVASGRWLRTLEGQSNTVTSVAFDPLGSTLATGSHDQTVKVWDVASGQLVHTLDGHLDLVTSVAFDPRGHTLASASGDYTAKLWDVTSGRLVRTLDGNHELVTSVAFDPQGHALASASSDQTVKLWDAKNGRLLHTVAAHQSWVRSVAFNHGGRTLASGSQDRTLKLWDVAGGQLRLLRTLEGHRDWVRCVAFDPTGAVLASASDDPAVALWDVASGQQLRTLKGHTSWVRAVAFDPRGVTLASGSDDTTVRVWDAESGRHLRTLTGHQQRVRSVAFGPQGTLASGGDDRTVQLWNTASNRPLYILNAHESSVTSVAFDPHGRTLASGSHDRTVNLWDVATGRLVRSLAGHLGAVLSVGFAPNGEYLVTCGDAGRIQFWDVNRGETFLYLYAFGPGAYLALLPDGRFDGSQDALRHLCYTESETLTSFNAEELIKEFHSPDAVRDVLAKYTVPLGGPVESGAS
jgi:WD40 repeat protein